MSLSSLSKLENLVAYLEQMITSTGADVSGYLGTFKTIEQRIEDRFEYLKTLVNGALAFSLYSQMQADTTQPANTLARVWNDPNTTLNGIYGWDGSQWVRSPLDATAEVYSELASVIFTAPAAATKRLLGIGVGEYTPEEYEEFVPTVIAEETNQALLAFDKLGRALLDLHPSAMQKIAQSLANNYELSWVEPEGHSADILFAVTDDAPRPSVLAQVDTNGNWHFSNSKMDYGVNLINRPVLYHFVNDGQSQSLGATASPALTTAASFSGNVPLMPEGGLTSQSSNALATFDESIGDSLESPAGGMAAGLIARLKNAGIDVDAAKFKFAFSCPGVGGTKIERYVEGGDLSERFFNQITQMQKNALAAGLDYQLHGYTWTLGGTDMGGSTTYQEYYDHLIAMHDYREAQARIRLGRPALALHCFAWQNGARSWVDNIDVGRAQVDAAKNHERIHLICPYYCFEFNDSVHLTNTSSKLLGYYMQRAYATVVIEGKTWKPLDIESATAAGQTITLNFYVPHPPLEFDTERLKSIANQGFHVEDDLGELTITDVQIVGGVSVQITVGRALDANPKVGYAIKYNDNGAANDGNHPRGHLRDSAGYTDKYIEPTVLVDGNPLEIPLHNWSLTFLKDIEV